MHGCGNLLGDQENKYRFGSIFVPMHLRAVNNYFPIPLYFPEILLRSTHREIISLNRMEDFADLALENALVSLDLLPTFIGDPANLLALTVVRLPLIRLTESIFDSFNDSTKLW